MTADAETALFSLKTYAAALISYYLSLRIYIVAQPLAGMVLSKALFRVLGTFLGAAAKAIAAAIGYQSASAFSTVFRRGVGNSPSQFARSITD